MDRLKSRINKIALNYKILFGVIIMKNMLYLVWRALLPDSYFTNFN